MTSRTEFHGNEQLTDQDVQTAEDIKARTQVQFDDLRSFYAKHTGSDLGTPLSTLALALIVEVAERWADGEAGNHMAEVAGIAAAYNENTLPKGIRR